VGEKSDLYDPAIKIDITDEEKPVQEAAAVLDKQEENPK
jgi:hypothetical protein